MSLSSAKARINGLAKVCPGQYIVILFSAELPGESLPNQLTKPAADLLKVLP
jgi:hypothetical protein